MKQFTLGLALISIISIPISASAGFFDDLKEKLDEKVNQTKEQVGEAIPETTPVPSASTSTSTSTSTEAVTTRRSERTNPISRNQASITEPQARPEALLNPATAGKTSNIDIIGLRLGMSAQDARATLQSYDATLQVREIVGHIPRLTNSTYPQHLAAASRDGEQISVELTTPPLASTVARISRAKKYSQGNQPTLDNTLKALKQKYGEPSTEKNLNAMLYQFYWLHDQHGNKYTAPSPQLEQSCTLTVPASVLVNLQHQKSYTPSECGIALTVLVTTGFKMAPDGKSMISDGMVGELSANMTSVSELIRNAQETQAHVDRTLKAQADSLGAPRL